MQQPLFMLIVNHLKQINMNNYIIISQTYAETTPESCEDGDFSDTGFVDECKQVTFTELVDLMKTHYQPSQSPNDGNADVSYSTGFYVQDYRTNTHREECIHFHDENTPNAAKYWKLAAKFAGLVK